MKQEKERLHESQVVPVMLNYIVGISSEQALGFYVVCVY